MRILGVHPGEAETGLVLVEVEAGAVLSQRVVEREGEVAAYLSTVGMAVEAGVRHGVAAVAVATGSTTQQALVAGAAILTAHDAFARVLLVEGFPARPLDEYPRGLRSSRLWSARQAWECACWAGLHLRGEASVL